MGDLLELSEESLKAMIKEVISEAIEPLKSPEAPMAEEFAKFSDAIATLEEAKANLEAEIARLESEEHSQEIIEYWLNEVLPLAEPEKKIELGLKLGLDTLFREAGVAEGEESPAGEKEPDKSVLERVGDFLAKKT